MNLDKTNPDKSTGKNIPQMIFGRYTVLSTLGEGGMGKVYRVLDTKLKRVVALKTLLHGVHANEKAKERFFVEAQAIAKINHPNIIQLYDMGTEREVHYYTMDYISGSSLKELMDSKSLGVRKGIKIMETVAQAMNHCHELGIIHRDLKPANIMLDEDGKVYVMDFGLAKTQHSKKITRTGAVLGTPLYMSPEQAEGLHRKVDATTDTYALGAILYEILTGRPPFQAQSHTAMFRKILNEKPVLPSKVNIKAPKELDKVCMKALAKKKEDRYASCKTFARDLNTYLQGKKITTSAPSRTPLIMAAVSTIVICVALFFMLFSSSSSPHSHQQKKSAAQENYTGQFVDGKRHGQGILIYRNGDKYSGNFANGLPDGQGVFIYKNGEQYIGQWKNGKRHGEGVIYRKNRSVKKKGIWKEGAYQEPHLIQEPHLLPQQQHLAPALQKGLLAYYDFDGAFPQTGVLKDRSQSHFDLKMRNGKVSQKEGVYGKAAYFYQGFFGAQPDVTESIMVITISLWFKTNNPTANYKIAGSAWWKERGKASGWLISTHNIELWAYDTKPLLVDSSQTKRRALAADRWNHLVIVHDLKHVYEYNNGKLWYKAQSRGQRIGTGIALSIGSWHGNYPYRGFVDEFRIYSRALSAEEVKQLHDHGRATIDGK
ncbi:protein kinase domain-containing protein [Candidatus Uabimicrobium amorphum]|uniref:non-specific serine/threonine protein kinase n=1 Tax=Uabimicrobium amorphum TaxID=2596890 RepID=A0A5S9ILH5_UABAM|nr:protein kinase [Candidatus Uabimicrobium amorphum]BBM83717.1 protein kinase [Candidatus Uabimicrobium amorphum]